MDAIDNTQTLYLDCPLLIERVMMLWVVPQINKITNVITHHHIRKNM